MVNATFVVVGSLSLVVGALFVRDNASVLSDSGASHDEEDDLGPEEWARKELATFTVGGAAVVVGLVLLALSLL